VGKRRAPEGAYLDTKASEFVCRHCGAREPVGLPIDVRVLADGAKAFGDAHARCAQQQVARG
jgi:hypothetical protein